MGTRENLDDIDRELGLGKYAASTQPQPQPQEPSGVLRRAVVDPAVSFGAGVLQLPGMVTGLADIPTGGAVGRAADWAGQQTGFQPSKWAEDLNKNLSPETQAAKQKVNQAEGFWNTVGTAVQNPSAIASSVAESLPGTILGGGVGGALAKGAIARGAGGLSERAAVALGAGVGEGLITAGSIANEIGQNPNAEYFDRWAAIPAGVITGAIGAGVANKVGTVGSQIAGKVAGVDMGTFGGAGRVGNAIRGAFNEGVLEELPQSFQEQIWTNIGQGNPWDQQLGNAAAQGMLAGMGMGAGFGAMMKGQQNEPPPAQVPATRDLLNPNGPTPVGLLSPPPSPVISMPNESGLQMKELFRRVDERTANERAVKEAEFRNEQLWLERDQYAQRLEALGQGKFDWNNQQNLPTPEDPGSAAAIITHYIAQQRAGKSEPVDSAFSKAYEAARQILPDWMPENSVVATQSDAITQNFGKDYSERWGVPGSKKEWLRESDKTENDLEFDRVYRAAQEAVSSEKKATSQGANSFRDRIGAWETKEELLFKLQQITNSKAGQAVKDRANAMIDVLKAEAGQDTAEQNPGVQTPEQALRAAVGAQDLVTPEANVTEAEKTETKAATPANSPVTPSYTQNEDGTITNNITGEVLQPGRLAHSLAKGQLQKAQPELKKDAPAATLSVDPITGETNAAPAQAPAVPTKPAATAASPAPTEPASAPVATESVQRLRINQKQRVPLEVPEGLPPEQASRMQQVWNSLSALQQQILKHYSSEKMTFQQIALEMVKGDAHYAKIKAALELPSAERTPEQTLLIRGLESQAESNRKAFERAKKALIKAGVPAEQVERQYPNENNRLQGGADVNTLSISQAAELGLHVPGGNREVLAGDNEQFNDDGTPKVRAMDGQLTAETDSNISDAAPAAKQVEEEATAPDVADTVDEKREAEKAQQETPKSEWEALSPAEQQAARDAWSELTAGARKQNGRELQDAELPSFDSMSDAQKAQFFRFQQAYFNDEIADNSVFGVGTEPGILTRQYGIDFSTKMLRSFKKAGREVTGFKALPKEHRLHVVRALLNLAQQGYPIDARIESVLIAEVTPTTPTFAVAMRLPSGKYAIAFHPKLFDHAAERVVQETIHEVAHTMDDSQGARTYSSDPMLAFMGPVYREFRGLLTQKGMSAEQAEFVSRFVDYPIHTRHKLSNDGVAKEMFAQIMAAYHTNPEALEQYAPTAYYLAEQAHADITTNGFGTAENEGSVSSPSESAAQGYSLGQDQGNAQRRTADPANRAAEAQKLTPNPTRRSIRRAVNPDVAESLYSALQRPDGASSEGNSDPDFSSVPEAVAQRFKLAKEDGVPRAFLGAFWEPRQWVSGKLKAARKELKDLERDPNSDYAALEYTRDWVKRELEQSEDYKRKLPGLKELGVTAKTVHALTASVRGFIGSGAIAPTPIESAHISEADITRQVPERTFDGIFHASDTTLQIWTDPGRLARRESIAITNYRDNASQSIAENLEELADPITSMLFREAANRYSMRGDSDVVEIAWNNRALPINGVDDEMIRAFTESLNRGDSLKTAFINANQHGPLARRNEILKTGLGESRTGWIKFPSALSGEDYSEELQIAVSDQPRNGRKSWCIADTATAGRGYMNGQGYDSGTYSDFYIYFKDGVTRVSARVNAKTGELKEWSGLDEGQKVLPEDNYLLKELPEGITVPEHFTGSDVQAADRNIPLAGVEAALRDALVDRSERAIRDLMSPEFEDVLAELRSDARQQLIYEHFNLNLASDRDTGVDLLRQALEEIAYPTTGVTLASDFGITEPLKYQVKPRTLEEMADADGLTPEGAVVFAVEERVYDNYGSEQAQRVRDLSKKKGPVKDALWNVANNYLQNVTLDTIEEKFSAATDALEAAFKKVGMNLPAMPLRLLQSEMRNDIMRAGSKTLEPTDEVNVIGPNRVSYSRNYRYRGELPEEFVQQHIQRDHESIHDAVGAALNVSHARARAAAVAKAKTLLSPYVERKRGLIESARKAVSDREAELGDQPFDLDNFADFSVVDSLPKELRPAAKVTVENIASLAKKGFYAIPMLDGLAKLVKKYIPAVTEYAKLMSEKGALRTDLELRVQRVVAGFNRLSAPNQKIAQQFMYDSTFEGKWAHQYEWLKEQVEIDPQFKVRWAALPKDVKAVVEAVFKHGYDTLREKRDAVNLEVTAEYDALIKQAREANVAQEEIDALIEERKEMLRRNGTFLTNVTGPYVSLRRFGDYAVVWRSDALKAAIASGDKKEADRLEAEPGNYRVTFKATAGEAAAEADRWKAEGLKNAVSFEKVKWHQALDEMPFSTMQRVKTQLSGMEDPVSHAMNRMLTKMYVEMLSDASGRKGELSRRKIDGLDPQDIMRSFALQGEGDAAFVAALKKSGEIQGVLQSMRNQAANGPDRERDARNKALNEILARHAAMYNTQPTPIQDAVMAFNSVWYLLTSPAFVMQQLSQPFMMSHPMMAAKYGWTRAFGELIAGFKEVNSSGLFREMVKNFKGAGDVAFDLSGVKNKVGNERGMLEELRNYGLIDHGIGTDLGYLRSNNAVGEAMSRVHHKLSLIARNAEITNRVATSLTAYRLAYDSSLPPEQAHKKASEYARQVIGDTHGDYSPNNAPGFMMQGRFQGIPVKAITQFRKFQIVQLSFFAEQFHKAFFSKDISPDERAVARAVIGYTFSHYGVMTGALGLPAANVIGMLLVSAGGDDEPKDAEYRMRKALTDAKVPVEVQNILINGVPTALGMNVTGKIGAGYALSVLPFTDIDLTKKQSVAELSLALLGPTGAIAGKMADGAGMIAKGDLYKGYEMMMPKGISDGMRALRFAQEGVTARNNDVVMKPEEISFAQAMMQGLGLPPDKIQKRQWAQSVQIEFTKALTEQTAELKHRYAKAVREGDTAGRNSLIKEWVELQKVFRDNKIKPPPLTDLTKAPVQQVKREQQVSPAGLPYTEKTRGFTNDLGTLLGQSGA